MLSLLGHRKYRLKPLKSITKLQRKMRDLGEKYDLGNGRDSRVEKGKRRSCSGATANEGRNRCIEGKVSDLRGPSSSDKRYQSYINSKETISTGNY